MGKWYINNIYKISKIYDLKKDYVDSDYISGIREAYLNKIKNEAWDLDTDELKIKWMCLEASKEVIAAYVRDGGKDATVFSYIPGTIRHGLTHGTGLKLFDVIVNNEEANAGAFSVMNINTDRFVRLSNAAAAAKEALNGYDAFKNAKIKVANLSGAIYGTECFLIF